MYNILSVQTYNIRNISGCFNNIVFILVTKMSCKKICDEIENNSTLEKGLIVCNRNAELLRLVEASLIPKWQEDEEEKFDNSEKFAEKKFAIFCFISLSLLTFELSNIN